MHGVPPVVRHNLRKKEGAMPNENQSWLDCLDIIPGLVMDGIEFATSLDRCRYGGTLNGNRSQWLKDHPGVWRRVENVLREAASRRCAEIPAEAAAAGPSSHIQSDILKDDKDADGAASASALPPVPRPVLYGTTKAEVLNCAKAAVGSRARLRDIAERLACAHIDFHASQREIGRAIGRSASWVNRLLKWRQSGYEQCSPFGPTTRAGRTARRNDSNNDLGACGGDEQVEDDGTVSLVGHCSPPSQPASPQAPVNENLPSGSTQTEPLPDGEAATRETKGLEPQPTPVESGSLHLQKPKLPARNSKIGRKLSPERMRIVIEALKEYPILARAAAKAGIHRKTLTYWLKCSEAGQDSYDIKWKGFQWRFHQACGAAIDLARDRLLGVMYDIAMGPITYKIDQDLVALGNRGADAYARDENGEFIVETRGPGNVKMLEFLLQLWRPEKWGKARKREIFRSGGVLVIGERPNRSEKNCAASIRARQWKSALRKIGETKA
jgi:hypothetical protein